MRKVRVRGTKIVRLAAAAFPPPPPLMQAWKYNFVCKLTLQIDFGIWTKMIVFIFQLFWKDELMKMKKRMWERWQTLMHLKQAVVVGLQASVTARVLPTTLSKTGSKVC